MIDEEAFKSDLTFIRAMIHYEIDLALFGVGEARRNLILQDPQAQFALSQFGEAQRLTELARNTPRRRWTVDAIGHLAPIFWGGV